MAEVKDKIVTVESLSALHEYNKNAVEDVRRLVQDIDESVQTLNNAINFGDGMACFTDLGGEWVDNGHYSALVDTDGNIHFPVTTTDSVQDMNSGKTLSKVLTEKVDKSQAGMTDLFATGYTFLSAYQYGDDFPEGYVHSENTKGVIFFKKAQT